MNKVDQPHRPTSVLRVLDAIFKDPGATQRDVARETGLSVGMVNVILTRLSKTGYIKIKGLTRRKLSYIVTPRGLAEKTRQSTSYLQHTLQTYEKIRERLVDLVKRLQSQGHHQFLILGSGEVARLTEMVCRELLDAHQFLRTNQSPKHIASGTMILDCTVNGHEPAGISVLANLVGSNEHSVTTLDEQASFSTPG